MASHDERATCPPHSLTGTTGGARSRGEALRRGSAFFLAQKGAHAKVVDLLNSANSENGPKVGPKAPPSPKLFF